MIKEKEIMGILNKFSEQYLRIIFGIFALIIVTCITFFSNYLIWKLIAFLLSSYAFIEWLNAFERRKINVILFYVVFIIAIYYFLNLSDLIFSYTCQFDFKTWLHTILKVPYTSSSDPCLLLGMG